jgi:7-cyano-7-deazaguanine synthase
MTTQQNKKAVVLLSGGLDSATTLAYAASKGFDCHAITFDYGQRHKIEIKAAKKVAKALGAARHLVIKIDLRKFGGSALTSEIPVPKGRSAKKIGEGIPATYVPARNTVFLSLALALAEAAGARDIFIGVNALDYSGYPDCRPEFIRAFERTANLGTKAGVEGEKFRIHAPLIKMTKAVIVKLGRKLGVDFEMTHSCYDPLPDGTPCGKCDSCLLREKGFKEAGK